jgi:formylglycine-generating enzyme required for sulfatase activity
VVVWVEIALAAGPLVAGGDGASATLGALQWVAPPAGDADGFWMMATEVTQGMYRRVLATNPAVTAHQGVPLVGDDLPVQNVPWTDALAFANAVSLVDGLTPCYDLSHETPGMNNNCSGYRLPSERQWDWAARGGAQVDYTGTSDAASVCEVGNVADASLGRRSWYSDAVFPCDDAVVGLSPVARFRPNGVGLYDMTGNVAEWTWHSPEPGDGPVPGAGEAYRGGSWFDGPAWARLGTRGWWTSPGYRASNIGFRLMRTASGGAVAAAASTPATDDWMSPTLGVMKRVPSGTFRMGAPPGDGFGVSDERAHPVTLTREVWVMAVEVTQGVYRKLMAHNPSTESVHGVSLVGERLPVQSLRWIDAVRLANAASRADGLPECYAVGGAAGDVHPRVTWAPDCVGYRLPTEAEWEWAARGGDPWAYAGVSPAAAVCSVGNVSNPSMAERFGWVAGFGFPCEDGVDGLAPGGRYRPNGYGLYDLTGNVAELVWDGYAEYPTSATDPRGPARSDVRIARGGSFIGIELNSRVSARIRVEPGEARETIGVRLVRYQPARATTGAPTSR